MTKSVRRLYKELKPQSYELEITPDVTTMTFTGSVVVDLKKTGRPSQRITFHQHGLDIVRAEITKKEKKGTRAIPVTRINNQNTLDEVRLHVEDMIYAGEYTVRMEFTGKIVRGMTGMYPCPFVVDDKEHILLATQLESHHAREVFPCIDEPEAKATFRLSLTAPKEHTALSNMPIETQHDVNESLVRTTFETTPRMSTYLLAFVIGEIHRKKSHTARGTEVSVWGTIAQPEASFDFALDVAARCIEFFEEYFGVQYPLAKVDHIALPDFSSAAMENWGLVTYRELFLLVYPDESAQSTKERVAEVIAHETSHQWFGNLVTMKWWDDLWLNESFANVMGYEAPAALFPEWHLWDDFVASEGLASLRRDAAKGVQAIQTTVHHPSEIGTLFDPSIVYAKGGRLLNTLKTYIGEDAFRKGLTEYFTKHAYGNTTGNDLWESLQKTSGRDVAGFMNPWLIKSGFPILSVDQTGKDITITQSHFLDSGEVSDGRIWPVPLFANRDDLPELMTKVAIKKKLTNDELIILNRGAAGHYIVHYVQQKHKDYLAELARTQSLSAGERLMLLNGASMLSKANHQTFGSVLRLLKAYEHEQAEIVWGIMALILAESRRFIDHDESLEPRIKEMAKKLIQHEYRRLGWEEIPDESSADRKLRATVIALGGYGEDEDILKQARARFQAYVHESSNINPELRSIVFSIAIKHNVEEAFSYLLQLHDKTTNSDLKADCLAALTATENTDHAEILLSRLTDQKIIKLHDVDTWLVYLLRNRHTRRIAWDWMVSHWDWIEKTFERDKSFDSFPRYAASACNTTAWADAYKTFFGPKQDDVVLKRNITIGLAEIDTRVTWLERDLASVQEFFAE